MKRLAFLLSLLPLAACGGGPVEDLYVTRSDTGTIPVSGSASDERAGVVAQAAMRLPDGAGTVSNVRATNYPNGARQEIILTPDRGTHGENVIDVSIQTGPAGENSAGMLQIGKPSERGIRDEILARFPDVHMGIVTRPMRNQLGPFGLAIGKRGDGSRCVFAWQWVEDIRDARQGQSGFARFGALISGNPSPASIRVRLCRTDQTVDQLAALVEGLHFGDPSVVARIVNMDRRNLSSTATSRTVDRGRPVADVTPLPQSLEASISPAGPSTSPSRGEPPAAKAAGRVSKPRIVARRARTRKSDDAEAASPPPALAPPANVWQPMQSQPMAPQGPRYLAPVPNGRADGQAIASPGAAPAPARSRLDPGLPAQAYRGPSASQLQQPNPYGAAPQRP